MPVSITDKEQAPKNINALMVNFRELMIGLEEEDDKIREKLAKLKLRTRNTELSILSCRNRTIPTPPISTSTIPTDSSIPTISDTTDSYRCNRALTLPTIKPQQPKQNLAPPPPTPSQPPVRPPRSSDLLRNNLQNLCNLLQRRNSKTKTISLFRAKSKTMSSAAISATKARGALIVLEGVDRVGKSTLAKRLVDHLEKLRYSVSYCRFPDRETPVGQLIDDYLRTGSKQVDNHVMHLLFSANRWELSKRIRNTLNQGTSVVVDRYSYSGIAYSSAKSSLPIKWCCEVERGLPRPDLVIYLELRRDVQHQRAGFGDERFETKEMQDSVRLQYDQVMDLSKETWLKVDVNNKKPDQVLAEVIAPVKRCLESVATKELGTLDFFEPTS